MSMLNFAMCVDLKVKTEIMLGLKILTQIKHNMQDTVFRPLLLPTPIFWMFF
jgi:hypothetical protein